MHNSIQILHNPPPKIRKKHKQKNFLNENIWSPKQGETTVSQRSCSIRGESSQRLLTESSSPQHPTPGRRCSRGKPKMSHLPSLLCRQHGSICAVQTCQHCIAAFFSSTCISHPQRSEGADVKWSLGWGTCCARRAPSHHSKEPSLCTALQLLGWWCLSHRSAPFCWPDGVVWI